MVRLDVRAAAREEQPVEASDEIWRVDARAERRDQHRKPAGRFGDGADIFLADDVKGMLADRASAARNADDGG